MIAIKDMEMPKCCGLCRFNSVNGCAARNYRDVIFEMGLDGKDFNEERYKECPLVEVEE